MVASTRRLLWMCFATSLRISRSPSWSSWPPMMMRRPWPSMPSESPLLFFAMSAVPGLAQGHGGLRIALGLAGHAELAAVVVGGDPALGREQHHPDLALQG